MRRWPAACALASTLFWLIGWHRIPVTLYPSDSLDLRMTIDGCRVSSAEAEQIWLGEESRIRSANPQCKIRWSYSDGLQQITVSGRHDPALATDIRNWASLAFPGASARVLGDPRPVQPFFRITVPGADWPTTALWAKRVLAQLALSVPGVERIETEPDQQRILWVSLDPHKMAAVGIRISDVRSAMEASRTATAGPFRFEGHDVHIPEGAPVDVERLELNTTTDARIHLTDIAAIKLSDDIGNPSAFIDGAPCAIVKLFTDGTSNHGAVFSQIKQLLPPDRKLIFEEGAAPQRLLLRLVTIAGALLVLVSIILLRARIHSGVVILLICTASTGSVIYPILALVAQRPLTVEAMCGWGIGLVCGVVYTIKLACGRSRDGLRVADAIWCVLGSGIVSGAMFAAVSILLESPSLIPWEGAEAWLLTTTGIVLLASLIHVSRAPTVPTETPHVLAALTKLLLNLRRPLLRRHGLVASLVLVYGIASFIWVFKEMAERKPQFRSSERLLYFEFKSDSDRALEASTKISKSGLGASARIDRRGDRWLLTCHLNDRDTAQAAREVQHVLAAVPEVTNVRRLDEATPAADEFLVRTQSFLHPRPGSVTTIWLELEHPDRSYLQSQCREVAKAAAKLQGVVATDYSAAHVRSSWTIEKRPHATAAQAQEASALLEPAQPSGMSVGQAIWRGRPYDCNLTLLGVDARPRGLSEFLGLPLAQRTTSPYPVQFRVGDVVEPHQIETPVELERRDGRAYDKLTVELKTGSNPRIRDLVAENLAALPTNGLVSHVITSDGGLNPSQSVVMWIVASMLLAVLGVCYMRRAAIDRTLSILLGSLVTLLGSAAAIELSGTLREWDSQAVAIEAACVLFFLASNSALRERSPAPRLGVELLVLALVATACSMAMALPLEVASLLWIPAAALLFGATWGVFTPELLMRLDHDRAPVTTAVAPQELVVRNMTHRYGDPAQAPALDRVNLRVERGVFGLLGPNGAGKTTLLRILAGELKPTRGAAVLDGEDLLRLSQHGAVAMVPQMSGGYGTLTVREYLEYLASFNGCAAVEPAMEKVGLIEQAQKPIKDLSGGYLKRVDIARALLSDPRLLILDEPTSGLDPEVRIPLRRLISDLGRDRIVIFATHLVEDIEAVCSHLAILHHGQILFDGTLSECLGLFSGKVRVGEVSVEDRERLRADGYRIVSQSKHEGGWIVRIVAETAPVFCTLQPESPRLEDAFVALIEERRTGTMSWEIT